MTKRDFEAIARKLNATQPFVPSGDDAGTLTQQELDRRRAQHRQWTTDVTGIADALAAGNARFDYRRFYRACGVVDALAEKR